MTAPAPAVDPRAGSLPRQALARLRVVVVAGIVAGAVVLGAGGRAAMLLLRVTSPDEVRGVTSDDGFTIGRVTLSGTYALLAIGAGFGVLGAFVYQLVAPWLIGPHWLRRLTLALAGGAVGGTLLIHDDGVDFTLLGPTWLAVALFVALPGAFALAVAVLADRVSARASGMGPVRRWLVPAALVAVFPPILPLVAAAAVAVLLATVLACLGPMDRLRRARPYRLAVRGAWLGVAGLGAVALAGDVAAVVQR